MVTQRIINQQIDKDAVRAAAEEYVARQEYRSDPKMAEDHTDKYNIADEEKRSCCTPYLRRRYELNRHCRSAEHVANLFDVSLQDMMNEVTRLKGE